MEELVFKGANDQVLTNSLLVAEKFGKNHYHVLEAIKALLVSPENSGQTDDQSLNGMFSLVEYETPLNNGTNATRRNPMYVMNRDGFTLLAMGFTGSKALQFKMDYINAFNRMESMLKSDDYILARSQEILQSRLQSAQQQLQIAQGTIEHQQSQIKTLAPKAEYTDEVLQATSTYTFTQLAKEMNFTSAVKFIARLKEMKILFKQSGQYMLTAKYAGRGYTSTRTTRFFHSDGTPGTSVSTVFTENGRLFVHQLLKGGKSC